jgi:Ca2+-binding EF-hand superfamily protein
VSHPQVLRRLGAEASDDDVASMVAIADTNGDGVIDFEEFKKLMSTRFQS